MTVKSAFEFLERPPRTPKPRLGFTGVEVSEDSIDLAPGDRIHAIRQARASDYSYFHAWRGKKLPRIPAA